MHSHIVKCFHVASLGSEHAFLTNFKPLHHIFTFFSFQSTYSDTDTDDLPINIMHLYLPCTSWYLYEYTLYRWSICFHWEVCRDVILNRVVAGGEHHRVDMVRWLCLHWRLSMEPNRKKGGSFDLLSRPRVCVFCVVECRGPTPPFVVCEHDEVERTFFVVGMVCTFWKNEKLLCVFPMLHSFDKEMFEETN